MLSDTVSVDDAVFSETSSPVNPRKEYLSFVMTDAALLHATLSHSAVRHNILHGLPSPDSVYRIAKAIQIVNRRLRRPVPEVGRVFRSRSL